MNSENPDKKPLQTQCPQCQSSFRLTTQHLEAAKGWVQCGVCGHVFFSGQTSPVKPTEPQPPLPTAAPAEETPAINIQPVDMAISAQIAEEIPRAKPEPASPILSGLTNRMAEDEPTTMTFGPKLESIILVDPKASYEDHDPGPLPVIEPRSEPGRAAGLGSSVPPPHTKPASATGADWIPRQPSAPANQQKVPGKGTLTWLWWLLSIVLVLALIAQLAWFMRDSLAARYPALRPALAQMCQAMDCALGLPRDPKQVVILGSELGTKDDGHLVLNITLANKAKTRMAWPVLELTLIDVEDQPLARRVFAPSEYLSSAKQAAEGIAPLSEVPVELTMQSKDVKAAGYRLRMFY